MGLSASTTIHRVKRIVIKSCQYDSFNSLTITGYDENSEYHEISLFLLDGCEINNQGVIDYRLNKDKMTEAQRVFNDLVQVNEQN